MQKKDQKKNGDKQERKRFSRNYECLKHCKTTKEAQIAACDRVLVNAENIIILQGKKVNTNSQVIKRLTV